MCLALDVNKQFVLYDQFLYLRHCVELQACIPLDCWWKKIKIESLPSSVIVMVLKGKETRLFLGRRRVGVIDYEDNGTRI